MAIDNEKTEQGVNLGSLNARPKNDRGEMAAGSCFQGSRACNGFVLVRWMTDG